MRRLLPPSEQGNLTMTLLYLITRDMFRWLFKPVDWNKYF